VSTDSTKTPTVRIGEVNDKAIELYKAMREELLTSGPLDRSTCEIIVTTGFAVLGYELSFKVHTRRLISMNVPKAAVQHAVLATMGATTVIFQTAQALRWIDEVYDDTDGPA